MRKRKDLKNLGSDEEAEEFQDSGEDWMPEAGAQPAAPRKRGGRPPTQPSMKKKRKNSSSEESEEEPEGEEGGEDEESEEEKNGSDGNKSDSSQNKNVPKYFQSGNFVLLKSDVQWDEDKVLSKVGDLNLWKIDGKALLQKYIPVESNGRFLHKCTCVYSGWNVDNRENYYPITEILERNPKTDIKETCVGLDLADLIKVRDKN